MRKRSRPALFVLVAALVVGIAGLVSAQGTRSAAPGGEDALLAEVRALRAELAQAAAVSIRAQLLVARLQVQEQRVAGLGRQLLELDGQIAPIAQEVQELTSQLGRLSAASMPAEQQEELAGIRAELKRRITDLQQREQQMRAQQLDVSNAVSAEQGRWIDFNNRLDEIERGLPAAR
jgi:hypothetical protein